jgi:5-methylcytosine-specific restriction protein A
MSSYLITFKPATENPGRGWPLDSLRKLIFDIESDKQAEEPWRFASRKAVREGDPVFLLVQGKLGPAIIGHGLVSRIPTKDEPAIILFDQLVDPTKESLIGREKLLGLRDSKSLWRSQASGVKIREDITLQLEEFLNQHPSGVNPNIFRKVLIDDHTYLEGRVRQVTMNLAERNPQARKDAIHRHGVVCTVCDFDFEKVFGPLGKGFIHFHHTSPIAGRSGHSKTSLDELLPVCPNCHSMLHRNKIPLSVSELRRILADEQKKHRTNR